MKTRSLYALSIFALLAAQFLTVTPSDANLILNSGFEQPTTSTDLFIPAGDLSLVAWTVVSGSVDVVPNTGRWSAFEGTQSLDLDGQSAGTIEQFFATTAGTTYLLSFEYANNLAPPISATVSVLGAGAFPLLSQDISHSSSTALDMDWTHFVSPFTANSAMTTLRFSSLDFPSSFAGIALDAVSVIPFAIPEPQTYAMMLVGLGLLAFGRVAGCRKKLLLLSLYRQQC